MHGIYKRCGNFFIREACRRAEKSCGTSLAVELGARLALRNEIDAGKDKQHRHTAFHAEDAQPHSHRNDGRHNGLGIVVHTDDGGSQQVLPRRHKEIREERGSEHDVENAPPKRERHGEVIDRHDVARRNGQEENRGEKEKPLAHGYGRVARYKSFEQREIDAETYLRQETEQVAEHAAAIAVGGVGSIARDEYQRARYAECDADDFFPCNRFAQEQGSQYHGDDGRRGGDDRGIDGRRERKSVNEHTLIERDAQKRREDEAYLVAVGHVFVREKKR